MKKVISFMICACLLCGISLIPVSSAPENTQVTVNMATVPPTVDGIVNSDEYGKKIHSVDYSTNEFISQYDLDKDIDADFYMAYNENDLYMAWVVRTDGHWPIDLTTDYNDDGTVNDADLGYMSNFSCIQFMICTGAPDKDMQVYQTGAWAGDYLEAGLSIQNDNTGSEIIWCKPTDGQSFTIDNLDFSGRRNDTANTTTYEVKIPLDALGMTNIGEGTQFGLSYAIGDQEDFRVSENMAEWQDAMLGGKNMDAGAVITLSSETIDNSIMGTPVAYPEYNIAVTAAETYYPGSITEVTLTLNDITAEDGYGLVQLSLYYDTDMVEPVVKNDGNLNIEMGSFLKTAPNKKGWDNICKLDENNSKYDLAYLTVLSQDHAKQDGSIVIKVPFMVKANTEDVINFYVPHSETFCVDYDLNICYGNAGKVSLTKAELVPIIPNEGTGLTVDDENDMLLGLTEKVKVSELKTQFSGPLTILTDTGAEAEDEDNVGTGFKVTNGVDEITVVILGDINGDGEVKTQDYMFVKRHLVGSYTLDDYELKAACISGEDEAKVQDYIKIKRHIIGTYNLYE